MAALPAHETPQLTARQINQLLFALVSGLGSVAHEADVMEALEHFCEARLMYRAELKLRNQRAGITKRAP